MNADTVCEAPSGPPPCDYDLADSQADLLQSAALLPIDMRRTILSKIDHDAVVELFAQFIGLANSVVANNREMIEIEMIVAGKHYPDTATQINLPTIFGALNGAKAANRVGAQVKTCCGCAYRRGTPANQSPVTTCDIDWQRSNDAEFWCHEDLKDDGSPSRKCIGHIVAMKAGRAA